MDKRSRDLMGAMEKDSQVIAQGGTLAGAKKAHKLTIGNLAKIVLALLLIAFVFSKTSLQDLLSLWERISIPWFFAGLGLFILISLLKSLQYYVLAGRQVSYPAVLNIVVVQNAISNFVAAGLGIISYLTMFRLEKGVKLTRVAMVFLLSKLGDLVAIGVYLLISGFFVWGQVGPLRNLLILLEIGIILGILIFLATVCWREAFVSLLRKLLAWLGLDRIGLVGRGLEALQSLAEQEQGFAFRMVGLGILYSLFYQSVSLLWVYSTLQTFNLQIPPMGVVFVNSLVQVLSYLPIQAFGGLGVTESVSLYLYSFFGGTQAQLAPVLIGGRIIFWISNLVILLYLPMYAILTARAAHRTGKAK